MNIVIYDNDQVQINEFLRLLKIYEQKHNSKVNIISINNLIDMKKNIDDIDCLIVNSTLIQKNPHSLINMYSHNPSFKLIIFSNSLSDSIKAFEVNCFRFLLVPIDQSLFFKYLNELKAFSKKYLLSFYDLKHRKHYINVYKINYIEIYKRTSTVHLINKNAISLSRSMKEWMNILQKFGFYLCYRGILVNIMQIYSINEKSIIFNNKEQIPLSRRYKKNIEEIYYAIRDNLP